MPSDSTRRPPDDLVRSQALALAAFTLLRLTGRRVPWGSAPLAFTPYAVPFGAMVAAAARARRLRGPALLAAACSAVLALLLAPRLRRREQPLTPRDGVRLRITSVNVLKGRIDPVALVEQVRGLDCDVFAIQETSPRFHRQLVDAGLLDLLPHFTMGDGARNNDAGLFSRHRLEVGVYPFEPEYIGARVWLPGGAHVPVVSAHPYPPVGRGPERAWTHSLQVAPVPEEQLAGAVMAGDFNATLDHPQFRDLLARGWRDAAAEAGKAWRFTWVGQRVGLLRLAIDHVLVPPGAVVEDVRIDDVLGSDHRAITVTVVLPVVAMAPAAPVQVV